MVLELHGGQTTCTARVALVLHEVGVPFKFVPVDLSKGEHKAPSFLENQPFGQVPFIVRCSSFSSPAKQMIDARLLLHLNSHVILIAQSHHIVNISVAFASHGGLMAS